MTRLASNILRISRGEQRSHRTLLYGAAVAVMALLIRIIFIMENRGSYTDDAFIFYQYAKNLSTGGGLSLNPGETSFGVTSILWTVLLSIFHLIFEVDLVRIGQVTGIILIALSGFMWTVILCKITNREWIGFLGGGGLFVLNPISIFHSISGMDTSLSVFVLTLLFYHLTLHNFRYPLLIGILVGLNILSRPETLILVPLLLLFSISVGSDGRKFDFQKLISQNAYVLVGSLLIALPWFYTVYKYTGHIVPPTRIGKLMVWLPSLYNISFSEFSRLGIFDRLVIGGKFFLNIFSTNNAAIVFLLPYYDRRELPERAFYLPNVDLVIQRQIGLASAITLQLKTV